MSDIREICNLSDEEFHARRRQLRAELLPHVRRRSALPNGVALAFEATPDRRRALEDFVAFERGCCPGLRFALREGDGALHLEIHGLDPDANVFTAAESPPTPASSG
jgi:hypothetical protein